MKKLNLFFLSFLAFAFIACEEDEGAVDTTKPSITITSPTSGMELSFDESVTVAATVTDNLGLEVVTVWVTPPGGTAQEIPELKEEVGDFLNDNTKADISGTVNLTGGTGASGDYLITVRATDERGNVADKSVTVTVGEADAVAPTVEIYNPVNGGVYAIGSDLVVDGLVEENMNLSEVRVSLVDNAGNAFFENTIDTFEDGMVLELQDTISLADAPVGDYTLMVEAVDMNDNTASESVDVVVQESEQRTFTINLAPEDLPEGTTAEDSIYIAGEFAVNGTDVLWDAPGTNQDLMLTRNADGSYSIDVEAASVLENPGMVMFKFGREGGWDTEEVNDDCSNIENRVYWINGGTGIVDDAVVEAWKDRCE